MTATSAIASGTLINQRYRIERAIAVGGFGRTYLAWDDTDKKRCLLKEFIPDVHNCHIIQSGQAEFEREAGMLQRLCHPQIPRFGAIFASEGRWFLVQDYIEGDNYRTLLERRLARNDTFSEAEVILWLRSLLGVLDYIHRCGIIHRDISPDNIMLPQGGGPPMLIDFGGAVSLDGAAKMPIAGKLGYAPPEQLAGGLCSTHSDLYALGATALVLLTGKLPSQLYNTEQRCWQWRPWCKVSPALAGVLEGMVAAKPSQRWSSAAAVLAALPSGLDLMGDWDEPLPPPRYDYRAVAIAIIGICLSGAALLVIGTKIPMICEPLDWCDRDTQSLFNPRYVALQNQALRGYRLSQNASNLDQLNSAQQQLQTAIAQLQAIPPARAQYFLAQSTAIAYQPLLADIEARLSQAQMRLTQLQRLEATAEQLRQQEQQATTLPRLEKLQAEWEQLIDRLDSLPDSEPFSDRQQQLRKEYQNHRDRLQTQINDQRPTTNDQRPMTNDQ